MEKPRQQRRLAMFSFVFCRLIVMLLLLQPLSARLAAFAQAARG
jgi:type II secretory pathway component PulM